MRSFRLPQTHAADARSFVVRLAIAAALVLGYLVNPSASLFPTALGIVAVMYAVSVFDAALAYRAAGTEHDRDTCFNLALVWCILLVLTLALRALAIGGGM